MYSPQGQAKCKSCGVEIEAGEVRCARHERDFKRWLREEEGIASRELYVPRIDGMRALEATRALTSRQRMIHSLSPGLKPGERLNFNRKS